MSSLETVQQQVRTARETVASLVSTRASLEERAATLQTEREEVAFDAYTGDKAAKRRLDAINSEAIKHTTEAQSIDAALVQARARLSSAEADENRAREAANAALALQQLDEFLLTGVGLDEDLKSFLGRYGRLVELSRSLRALGALSRPSEEHLKTASRRALAAATMFTHMQFEFLPPNERHSFVDLTTSWARFVRDWATPRLAPDDLNARLQQELAAE